MDSTICLDCLYFVLSFLQLLVDWKMGEKMMSWSVFLFRSAKFSLVWPVSWLSVQLTGTVVKHKRGKFLADLARPGDEILVARGGQGGVNNLCSQLIYVIFIIWLQEFLKSKIACLSYIVCYIVYVVCFPILASILIYGEFWIWDKDLEWTDSFTVHETSNC